MVALWLDVENARFAELPLAKAFVMYRAAQVITIEGGKIRTLHQYFDLLTLLQQIGAAPK